MSGYFLDDVDMRKYVELLPELKWLSEACQRYYADISHNGVGIMLPKERWDELQMAIKKNKKATEWRKFSKEVSEMRFLD